MGDVQAGLGAALAIVAGTLLGSFALPMKYIRRWNWENTWAMYSVWALIVLPWLLAWRTVPRLGELFRDAAPQTLLWVFLFGAGWGVANVGFGLGLRLVGMALGMAIMLGLNNALGAVLPILVLHPADLTTPAGMAIVTAVGVMILGIMVCAVAGARKEAALRVADASAGRTQERQFVKGLAICLVAGVFGAMFNFALIAGKPLEEQAVNLGATPVNAPNATWCIALLGGFVITIAYCAYLKSSNKTWRLYAAEGSAVNWPLTFLMGLMWFAGVALFGMAVTKLGRFGPSIGWPIIQSMAVAAGNFWGLATGEWKGAGRTAMGLMALGLALLLAGIVIIGYSSTLSSTL